MERIIKQIPKENIERINLEIESQGLNYVLREYQRIGDLQPELKYWLNKIYHHDPVEELVFTPAVLTFLSLEFIMNVPVISKSATNVLESELEKLRKNIHIDEYDCVLDIMNFENPDLLQKIQNNAYELEIRKGREGFEDRLTYFGCAAFVYKLVRDKVENNRLEQALNL